MGATYNLGILVLIKDVEGRTKCTTKDSGVPWGQGFSRGVLQRGKAMHMCTQVLNFAWAVVGSVL